MNYDDQPVHQETCPSDEGCMRMAEGQSTNNVSQAELDRAVRMIMGRMDAMERSLGERFDSFERANDARCNNHVQNFQIRCNEVHERCDNLEQRMLTIDKMMSEAQGMAKSARIISWAAATIATIVLTALSVHLMWKDYILHYEHKHDAQYQQIDKNDAGYFPYEQDASK